jgi:hypothetical protein
LPITEFISADQRQSTISSWLLTSKSSWLQKKSRWPLFAMIIVDFSYALINSVLAAFNNWSLKVYIQATYKIVTEGAISANLSIVHILICCSHFIKVVTKDTALAVADRKLSFKIKKLFAALITCTSYVRFKMLLKNLCICLMSKKYTGIVKTSYRQLRDSVDDDFASTFASDIPDSEDSSDLESETDILVASWPRQ